MPTIEHTIKSLVAKDHWQVTVHGQRKLQERKLILSEITDATARARLIEEYPDYHHGPAALFLIMLTADLAIHVLWGISKAKSDTAYLVTAYVPDESEWMPDRMTRKTP